MNVLRFRWNRRAYIMTAALLCGIMATASAVAYASQSSAYGTSAEEATLTQPISVEAVAPQADIDHWDRIWIPDGVYDPVLADGDIYRLDGDTLLVIPQESNRDVLRYHLSPVQVEQWCQTDIRAGASGYTPPYCD